VAQPETSIIQKIENETEIEVETKNMRHQQITES